ncbi:MAG: hypothetical protein HOV68_24500 [Streptomycetaceae bacterium]|nr:hypothetical protein [Streptomycetaceae bacterium]
MTLPEAPPTPTPTPTAPRSAAWWCGWLLIATGIVHLGYGTIVYWSDLTDIATSGLGGASGDVDRERCFWFLLAGPAMLMTGAWARREYARQGTVPRILAWYLLFLGSLALLMPDGGFWLFLPQSALAFRAAARGPDRAAETAH